jgi:hypothetical protein
MSPVDPETPRLLEKLDRVPDLLKEARSEEEQKGGDRYALMEQRAQEHRTQQRPFLLAKPFRHRVQCSTGEHGFGAVEYELVFPQGKGLFGARERTVKFTETELHEVREHGAALPAKLAELLRALP